MTTVMSDTLPPIEFYDRVAHQHFGDKYGNYPAENDLCFQTIARIKPTGKIVELGCGDARVLKGLLKAGFDIHGFDASEAMLDIAAESGVSKDRLNLLDIYRSPLPFADNTIDVAFCSRTLSYLHDPMPALKELLRVTQSGGHVIVDFFHEKEAKTPRIRTEDITWGNDNNGRRLLMKNYAFSAQTILGKVRETFDLARVDVLYNSGHRPQQNVKRQQVKQLPNGYIFLQLQKT